jgi:hypothetical protein
MKRITAIEIENVRGIQKSRFDLELLPNKPHIVIAPNGTGKTSLARAFASVGARKLKLDDSDRFSQDPSNLASVSVAFVDDDGVAQTVRADETSSDMGKSLATHVIFSRVHAKARKFKAGAATAAVGEMRVTPIPLCKVVDKAEVAYSYRDVLKNEGWGKTLTVNLTPVLKNAETLADVALSDLDTISAARVRRLADSIKQASENGTGVESVLDAWFAKNPKGQSIADWIGGREPKVSNPRLAAAQLLRLYHADKKRFVSAFNFAKYKRNKAVYRQVAAEVSRGAFGIVRVDEDKKSKMLQCAFPEASRMSNGERDAVILALELAVARRDAGGKPLLLVLDEIFDYLDRGNLIAFQFYIIELLKHCKTSGCQVFPVILTHHDAGYFFHNSFSSHKLRVAYLHPRKCTKSAATVRLLKLREDPALRDALERDFFHYSTGTGAISDAGLPASHLSLVDFRAYCANQAEQFAENKSYDAVAVCFALRHIVEKAAYDLLDPSLRATFLNTRKTNKKLEYAESHGVSVPDSHYLLGLIHNDTLHWKDGRDYVTPLEATLENGVVRELVTRLVGQ